MYRNRLLELIIFKLNLVLISIAFFMTYLTTFFLSKETNFAAMVITSAVAAIVYAVNRLTELKEDEETYPERTGYIKQNLIFQYLTIIISVILLIFLLPGGTFTSIIFLMFLIIVSVLYSITFIPPPLSRFLGGAKNLKEVPLFKSIIISLMWASLGSFFVSFYVIDTLTLVSYVLFLFFFAQLYVNTSVFDMRDYNGDLKRGLRTLPVVFGLEKTEHILHTINFVASIALVVLCVAFKLDILLVCLVLFSFIYTVGYLCLANTKYIDMDLLCDVFIDGAFFVYVLFIILANSLI